MDEVKVIKAIYCTKERRGKGTELDPVRVITEIFDFKGNLIAEDDPHKVFTKKDMASFALYVANKDWLKTDIIQLYKDWCNTED